MLRILLALAALSGLLAGCGQSGPLYLPGDPSAILSAPAPAAEEPEEEDEDAEQTDPGS